MSLRINAQQIAHTNPEIIACTAACAATGIELAETIVLYAAWLAWCVGTFCDD